MTTSKELLYWNERAATYDANGWTSRPDLLGWSADHTARMLREAPGFGDAAMKARTLEVGCGTGTFTEALLDRWLAVDAVDLSPEMVDRARARLASRPALSVEAVADPLSLPPGRFAGVVSRMVLHHAPDSPLETVKRWREKCLPGCAVVVVEGPPQTADRTHPAWALYDHAMFLKEPGRFVFTGSDVADWLFAAGCEDVRVVERWTKGNSLRAWLTGSGIVGFDAERILDLHRHAHPMARELCRIEEAADGDVVMAWRHMVVAGW
jgi:SAM-dependent methyltransferase